MKKFKLIMNYLCSLIIIILLFILIISCILKYSVFNKNYLYKELERNNYYDNLMEDIDEEISGYIMSSGFNKEIIGNLYTKEKVISDVKLFIDNYYSGKETIVETHEMYKKIEDNIKIIEERDNLQILDKNSIKNFILDILDIYQNEISLYKMMNSFISSFIKMESLINNMLIFTIIFLLLFVLFMNKFIPNNFFPSCIMSVGILLIIMRIFLYERIDVGNILIITKNFSIILNQIVVNIGKIIYIISMELILVSILFMLNSVKQKKYPKYLLK